MKAHAFLSYIADSPLYRWRKSIDQLFDSLECMRQVFRGANTTSDLVAAGQAGLSASPDDPSALVQAVHQLAVMPASERWQMRVNGRR